MNVAVCDVFMIDYVKVYKKQLLKHLKNDVF